MPRVRPLVILPGELSTPAECGGRVCVRAFAYVSKSPLIPFICTAGIRAEGRTRRARHPYTSRCFPASRSITDRLLLVSRPRNPRRSKSKSRNSSRRYRRVGILPILLARFRAVGRAEESTFGGRKSYNWQLHGCAGRASRNYYYYSRCLLFHKSSPVRLLTVC